MKPSRSAEVRGTRARPSSSAKSKSPRVAAKVAMPSVPAKRKGVIQGRPFRVELESGDSIAVGELLAMSMGLPDAAAIERFRERYPRKNTKLVTPIVPTDDELRRARELVRLVGEALIYGTRASWERIRRAFLILREIENTQNRIARCVERIEQAVESWHSPHGFTEHMGKAVIDDLAWYEPPFRELTVAGLLDDLKSSKPKRVTSKGGRHNTGALSLAAAFTLDVGAFGYARAENESQETALKRIKTALGVAAMRSGKTLQKETK